MNAPDKLERLPPDPGVYLFKDRKEKILYVGKAKSLKARVRSYFQERADLGPRKEKLVRQISDLDWIVTASELEAFILEASLIKKHKPPYNVFLRDDKSYPYLCLAVNEEWPALRVIRRLPRDGSICFGPYVPASAMWETLAFIRRTFPIRTCGYRLDKPMRPCVEYQMGRCSGPCGGKIERDAYLKIVSDVRQFLRGERGELLDDLRARMQEASEKLEFEEAAALRDRIARIEKALESQRIVAPGLGDIDVFGFHRQEEAFTVQVFFVRTGVIVGGKDFFVSAAGEETDSELLAAAVDQFYAKSIIPPREVLLALPHPDGDLLGRWLSERAEQPVRVTVSPKSGKRADLVDMANDNARAAFVRHMGTRQSSVLDAIRELFDLRSAPRTIHAFDISTLGGTESVGARVCWSNGRFVKDEYRRYRIQSVEGMDDFSMIREVVGRSYDTEPLPDLILIDGGRGQLDAALAALHQLGHSAAAIAALAKLRDDQPERVYRRDARRPIPLDPALPSSKLLQRIRDEVHRFAISYHRVTRAKRVLSSSLESIPGVGRARRLALLKAFGGMEQLKRASLEDIQAVKGIDRNTASRIFTALNGISPAVQQIHGSRGN